VLTHGKTVPRRGTSALTRDKAVLTHGKTVLTHGKTVLRHGTSALTRDKTAQSWPARAMWHVPDTMTQQAGSARWRKPVAAPYVASVSCRQTRRSQRQPLKYVRRDMPTPPDHMLAG
jgi:hypothetical protein